MKKIGIVLLVVISFVSVCYAQKIYIWTDEKGIKHYTHEPPSEGITAKELTEVKDTTEKKEPEKDEKLEEPEIKEEFSIKEPVKTDNEEYLIYNEAFEALKDIKLLLGSTGLTLKQYDEYLAKASVKVTRLDIKNTRGEKLNEILVWYKDARECWYQDIQGKKFDTTKNIEPIWRKIRDKYSRLMNSWNESRHFIWSENARLINEYEKYFK